MSRSAWETLERRNVKCSTEMQGGFSGSRAYGFFWFMQMQMQKELEAAARVVKGIVNQARVDSYWALSSSIEEGREASRISGSPGRLANGIARRVHAHEENQPKSSAAASSVGPKPNISCCPKCRTVKY